MPQRHCEESREAGRRSNLRNVPNKVASSADCVGPPRNDGCQLLKKLAEIASPRLRRGSQLVSAQENLTIAKSHAKRDDEATPAPLNAATSLRGVTRSGATKQPQQCSQ